MTAELAVVLPAVLLVVAACLGALRLGVEQARVDAAAALVARALARGDPQGTAMGLGATAGADSVTIERRAGLVCASAAAASPVLGLPLRVTSTSCALEPR